MKYFQSTTDASYLYHPTTASGSEVVAGSAEIGNLADVMRHSTIFKASYIAPVYVERKPSLDEEKLSTASNPWL